MKQFLLMMSIFFVQEHAYAQQKKADSLETLLSHARKDTSRVNLMWQLASATSLYNPEKALVLAQQAVLLAQRIKYIDGESRSLGVLANAFLSIGNYPRALATNFEKLQLDEKQHNPRNMANALMKIGAVYVYEEEYQLGLKYYYQSDSVIKANNIEDFKYFIALNLGDVYNRLNISDSSYNYFNKSLQIAVQKNDSDWVGTSMTGLGHCYTKMSNYQFALFHYHSAIQYLETIDVHDDEVLCEALLGMANLYQKMNRNDSAQFFARRSLNLAKADNFLLKEMEAAEFLTNQYKATDQVDSAFATMSRVQELNSTLNSKSRIRQSQVLSTNEQLRQVELEENRKEAEKERKQQLQYLFIGMFIPGFFLFTLLLSRIRVHVRLIKILGILSLLLVFEYLTLLLHPYVADLTHHTPVYELLIFVSIATLLIPSHHKIEHWLIEKLVSNRKDKLKLKKVNLKVKDPDR